MTVVTRFSKHLAPAFEVRRLRPGVLDKLGVFRDADFQRLGRLLDAAPIRRDPGAQFRHARVFQVTHCEGVQILFRNALVLERVEQRARFRRVSAKRVNRVGFFRQRQRRIHGENRRAAVRFVENGQPANRRAAQIRVAQKRRQRAGRLLVARRNQQRHRLFALLNAGFCIERQRAEFPQRRCVAENHREFDRLSLHRIARAILQRARYLAPIRRRRDIAAAFQSGQHAVQQIAFSGAGGEQLILLFCIDGALL